MEKRNLRFIREAKIVLVEDTDGVLGCTYNGVTKIQEDGPHMYYILGGVKKIRVLGKVQNVMSTMIE